MAFNISKLTLERIQGTSCSQKPANCQNLSETEESTLLSWILDIDRCGLSLQLSTIYHLAQNLLSVHLNISSNSITIRGQWVNHYIQCHSELKSKYAWKYNYQCIKCENIELIKVWFKYVEVTIKKYSIIKNIYNIDKISF